MVPQRRQSRQTEVDRRRSARWSTRRPINWRVTGGRRQRHSRVVERSLDGLVLMVEGRDFAQAGTRFVIDNPADATRFGFRAAVVRRTETLKRAVRLLYAEIEA
jgi:hypothetical protein